MWVGVGVGGCGCGWVWVGGRVLVPIMLPTLYW